MACVSSMGDLVMGRVHPVDADGILAPSSDYIGICLPCHLDELAQLEWAKNTVHHYKQNENEHDELV